VFNASFLACLPPARLLAVVIVPGVAVDPSCLVHVVGEKLLDSGREFS
jgi:hypothetical protein